jgi:hypothetical protein
VTGGTVTVTVKRGTDTMAYALGVVVMVADAERGMAT